MWLLASRGRPQSVKRFISYYIETKSSTPVYLRLDNCDPMIDEYDNIEVPKQFIKVISDRARLGAAMQEIFRVYPNEPWYGLLADDIVPRTFNWDTKLIKAAGNNRISQANDLTKKPRNYCHPCIGGDLVRKAGFFGFPHTTHYCLEVIWKELTKRDKRFGRYLDDVIVENMHPDFNKSKIDNTYQEAMSVKERDHEIWEHWKNQNFENFYQEVKSVLDND